MLKHILVAHDLSPEAEIAARRGAQLARQLRAEITLLHVIDEFFPPQMMKTVREAAEMALYDCAIRNDLPQAMRIVLHGNAAEMIVSTTNSTGADLLVVGEHHQQLLERFDGTTLEQVVRHARQPILLAITPEPQTYRHGLCGLDLSTSSSNAWRAACAVLERDAELLALHTCPMQEHAESERPPNDLHRLIEQVIHHESSKLTAPPPRLKCLISLGDVRERLAKAMARWQPGLLVLGSRSRGTPEQGHLGNTTRYYLQRPPCDLLVCQ